MQTQRRQNDYARYNPHHGPKQQLLGSQAHHVPPAWRTNGLAGPGQKSGGSSKGKEVETGSRIFISMLPFDVGEKEVEELFKKTVGPLKESFLVYNSQGKSKGMAVVTFQRPGDAAVARAKYHGKIVDARRPIRIEILVDDMPSTTGTIVPTPLTLLNRIAPDAKPANPLFAPSKSVHFARAAPAAKPHYVATFATVKPAPILPRKFRQKKGPKRLKKREHATVEDLDKEMDEYRASASELL